MGQSSEVEFIRRYVVSMNDKLTTGSARIEESVRRVVVHLPQSFPYAREWTSIARLLGAAPT